MEGCIEGIHRSEIKTLEGGYRSIKLLISDLSLRHFVEKFNNLKRHEISCLTVPLSIGGKIKFSHAENKNAVIKRANKHFEIRLHDITLSYVISFLEKWNETGLADVSHIDIELHNAGNSKLKYGFTIWAQSSEPPMSQEETLRYLEDF